MMLICKEMELNHIKNAYLATIVFVGDDVQCQPSSQTILLGDIVQHRPRADNVSCRPNIFWNGVQHTSSLTNRTSSSSNFCLLLRITGTTIVSFRSRAFWTWIQDRHGCRSSGSCENKCILRRIALVRVVRNAVETNFIHFFCHESPLSSRSASWLFIKGRKNHFTFRRKCFPWRGTGQGTPREKIMAFPIHPHMCLIKSCLGI